MQQPELGRRLTALRKERNLTQEELVQKSHVSVRTIQRIEAGEVMPRLITVRILLEALGESYESFSTQQNQVMETKSNPSSPNHRNTMLVAILAGAIYLVSEVILCMLDISWLTNGREWGFRMNIIYASLTGVMVISLALFARGFIALSGVFENTLLRVAAYLLIIITAGKSFLDIASLSASDIESVWIPYAVVSVLMGVVGIVFGIALMQLQDGMGELSRVAGILEVIMGCLLITVVLFFVSYLILIPTVVIEMMVLYRGYEYFSNPSIEGTAA